MFGFEQDLFLTIAILHNLKRYTYFPLCVGTISPLAGPEEVESPGAIRQSRPGCRGEAEGGTKTTLTLAGLSWREENLSRLHQSRVLDSDNNRAISRYNIQ